MRRMDFLPNCFPDIPYLRKRRTRQTVGKRDRFPVHHTHRVADKKYICLHILGYFIKKYTFWKDHSTFFLQFFPAGLNVAFGAIYESLGNSPLHPAQIPCHSALLFIR